MCDDCSVCFHFCASGLKPGNPRFFLCTCFEEGLNEGLNDVFQEVIMDARVMKIAAGICLAKLDLSSWKKEFEDKWFRRFKKKPDIDMRTMKGAWGLGTSTDEFVDYVCGKNRLC